MDIGLNIHLWAMWLRFEARTQNQYLYQGHESCCDAMHPNCSNDCKLYMAKRKREEKIIRRNENENKKKLRITKIVSNNCILCVFSNFFAKKFTIDKVKQKDSEA